MIYPPSRPTEDIDLESPRTTAQTREIATWLVVMAFAAAVVFNVSGIDWGFVSDRLLGGTEDVTDGLGPDTRDNNGLELPDRLDDELETPGTRDDAGEDGNLEDPAGEDRPGDLPDYPGAEDGDSRGESQGGSVGFPTPRQAATSSPPTARQATDTPAPPRATATRTIEGAADTSIPARRTATTTPDGDDDDGGYPSASPPTSTARPGYP